MLVHLVMSLVEFIVSALCPRVFLFLKSPKRLFHSEFEAERALCMDGLVKGRALIGRVPLAPSDFNCNPGGPRSSFPPAFAPFF